MRARARAHVHTPNAHAQAAEALLQNMRAQVARHEQLLASLERLVSESLSGIRGCEEAAFEPARRAVQEYFAEFPQPAALASAKEEAAGAAAKSTGGGRGSEEGKDGDDDEILRRRLRAAVQPDAREPRASAIAADFLRDHSIDGATVDEALLRLAYDQTK